MMPSAVIKSASPVGASVSPLIHFVVPLMAPEGIHHCLIVDEPLVEPVPIMSLHVAQLLANPRHPES
jgi:hypothetical protein